MSEYVMEMFEEPVKVGSVTLKEQKYSHSKR